MSEVINLFFYYLEHNIVFASLVIGFVVVVMLLSLAIIFKKIRLPAWKGLIPIYNLIVLLEVLEIPIWMIILAFIPFANIIAIPFLLVVVGWKLGMYCHKGILMRLGLILLAPIFYPILAASEIHLEGYVPVLEEVPKLKEFKLDALDVGDVSVIGAYNLDLNTLDQLAPTTVTHAYEPKVITKKINPNNPDDIEIAANVGEVEDLNRVLPTADDLTFDYSTLYKDVKKEETPVKKEETKVVDEKPIQIIEDILPSPEKEEEPAVEEETEGEPEEEEIQMPVIHDIVLEAAEPIDAMGPIAINQRDDFKKKVKAKDEVIKTFTKEELFAEDTPREETTPESTPVELEEPPVEEVPVSEEVTEAPVIEEQPVEEVVPEVPQEVVPEEQLIEEPIAEEMPVEEENPFATSEILPLEEEVTTPQIVPFEKKPEEDVPEVVELPVYDAPVVAAPPTMEEEPSVAEPPDLHVEETPTVAVEPILSPVVPEIPEVSEEPQFDQIVSMSIEEPDALPVGILYNDIQQNQPVMPMNGDEILPSIVEDLGNEPVQSINQVIQDEPIISDKPEMTREEAMGFGPRKSFGIEDPINIVPEPPQMNSLSSNYTAFSNTQYSAPVMNQPMNMNQNPYGGNQNGYSNTMMNTNYMNPGMNMPNNTTMGMSQPMPNGYSNQPNYTSIFQTGNGQSLLRPVENSTPVGDGMKQCPSCGMRVRQDCPACIMCGYRF